MTVPKRVIDKRWDSGEVFVAQYNLGREHELAGFALGHDHVSVTEGLNTERMIAVVAYTDKRG